MDRKAAKVKCVYLYVREALIGATVRRSLPRTCRPLRSGASLLSLRDGRAGPGVIGAPMSSVLAALRPLTAMQNGPNMTVRRRLGAETWEDAR